MISKLYRKLLPESFRIKIYRLFLGSILTFFRNLKINIRSKFTFFFSWLLPKTEENKAYAFMGKYGITSYPYKYMLGYKNKNIRVELDIALNLPYVLHNNKKLYFPNEFSTDKIIKDYRSLIIEQDESSAHRYVKSYEELKGKTLLDIGAAEGIFALDTIELTEQLYIFECGEKWIEPLNATFRPWMNKVSIVKKYVCDTNDENTVSLDEFLKDTSHKNLFLKMDIEGAEISALNGAAETLKNKNVYCAVCTYHRRGDPEKISSFFSGLGYKFEFTNGLMYWNKRLSKGLIRSYKSN